MSNVCKEIAKNAPSAFNLNSSTTMRACAVVNSKTFKYDPRFKNLEMKWTYLEFQLNEKFMCIIMIANTKQSNEMEKAIFSLVANGLKNQATAFGCLP